MGHAGTLESNDIHIAVTKMPAGHGVQIELTSIVLAQYGQAIKQAIIAMLNQYHINDILITANDKGALTCTIQARLYTALQRANLVK